MSPLLVVGGFMLSGAIVVLAGVALATSGDVIAARTKLGRLWVGTVFVAAATSLPELTTDIAAVRMGAADLAAGDLFGSSMANMLILGLVCLLPGYEPFRKAALDNCLVAALAIMMTAIATVGLLLRPQVAFLGVGPVSATLLILYVVATRVLYRHATSTQEAARTAEVAGGVAAVLQPEGESARTMTLRGAVLRFVGASVVILLAAPLFAWSAKGIAEITGLGSGFVGTTLVGISTSLPELVASYAAVRMHAYDMAIGNVFGSNAFNMTMFVALDVAYGKEPILGHVDVAHAVTGLAAIVLMANGLAAIVYRANRRFSMLEPSALVMLLLYVAGIALVYRVGH